MEENKKMTIQDYLWFREQRRARENLEFIILRQKHRKIAKEISESIKS